MAAITPPYNATSSLGSPGDTDGGDALLTFDEDLAAMFDKGAGTSPLSDPSDLTAYDEAAINHALGVSSDPSTHADRPAKLNRIRDNAVATVESHQGDHAVLQAAVQALNVTDSPVTAATIIGHMDTAGTMGTKSRRWVQERSLLRLTQNHLLTRSQIGRVYEYTATTSGITAAAKPAAFLDEQCDQAARQCLKWSLTTSAHDTAAAVHNMQQYRASQLGHNTASNFDAIECKVLQQQHDLHVTACTAIGVNTIPTDPREWSMRSEGKRIKLDTTPDDIEFNSWADTASFDDYLQDSLGDGCFGLNLDLLENAMQADTDSASE